MKSSITLLTLALATTVRADCWYDAYGYYRCSGLSRGARIGIGIAVFVLSILAIIFFSIARKRRIQNYNKRLALQQQQGLQQQPYQPGYGPAGYTNEAPYGNQQWNGAGNAAYPPSTHHTGSYAAAPPPGPPPPPQGEYVPDGPPQYSQYPAPGGPPPGKGATNV
ncbi:hypothetical protein FRB99_000326 [Tulasnella sp. 403]|nr:hypothetical protein FRB99_000326 [Tulasnella sp. 403]